MDFYEIIISETVGYIIAFIVALAIIIITIGINRIKGLLNDYFGLDLAEAEVYHVARRALKFSKNHDEAVSYVLSIVSDRLKEKNIKISQEELTDIIENTIEDLKEDN